MAISSSIVLSFPDRFEDGFWLRSFILFNILISFITPALASFRPRLFVLLRQSRHDMHAIYFTTYHAIANAVPGDD